MTALVLGILGIVICGVVAPFAWVIGKNSLDTIRNEPGWGGEGVAMAGYILGIVGTALLVLFVLVIFIYFIFIGAIIGSEL